jgi:hypothetical protein
MIECKVEGGYFACNEVKNEDDGDDDDVTADLMLCQMRG